MRDKDIRRMCAVQNSDDSGVGISVPDVAYPKSAPMVQVSPNSTIEPIEVRMRKIYSIFEDENNKMSDRLSAMQLFLEMERHFDGMNASEDQNDRLA